MNRSLRGYQSWSGECELAVPTRSRTTIARILPRRLYSVTTRLSRPHKCNYVECNDIEMCFLHAMKECRVIRGIAPLIHNLSNRGERLTSSPARFIPEKYYGSHRTGGWIGPRGGWKVLGKGKNLFFLPGFKPRYFLPVA
jgi:hypothetical protein